MRLLSFPSDNCKHDVISLSCRSTYSSLSESKWRRSTINQITCVSHCTVCLCWLLLSWQMITCDKDSSFFHPHHLEDCTYCTISVRRAEGLMGTCRDSSNVWTGQKQQWVICKVADSGTMVGRIRDRNCLVTEETQDNLSIYKQ